MFASPEAARDRLLWPVLATVLVISWSAGFVGTRFASEHADVILVVFWRTFIAGAILAPIAFLRGPRPSFRAVIEQMIIGAMIVYLYLGGFALAIGQRVPTGLVALISDLVPLMIAALSQPILGERLTARQWLGTGIGAMGVVIVASDSLTIGTAPLWAYLITVAAMLVFALASVLQKRLGGVKLPIDQCIAIHFLTGAALFALTLGSRGSLMPPADPHFIFGIGWLVLIPTFLCYSVYYTCLRRYPAAQVAAVIYLSPPVTMLWGAALFGEPLTLLMFVGLGVTMIGVVLTTQR